MDNKVKLYALLAMVVICLGMALMNLFVFRSTLMGYLWLAATVIQLPRYFRARQEYQEKEDEEDE